MVQTIFPYSFMLLLIGLEDPWISIMVGTGLAVGRFFQISTETKYASQLTSENSLRLIGIYIGFICELVLAYKSITTCFSLGRSQVRDSAIATT